MVVAGDENDDDDEGIGREGNEMNEPINEREMTSGASEKPGLLQVARFFCCRAKRGKRDSD